MIFPNGQWGGVQWGGYQYARWGGLDTTYAINDTDYYSVSQLAKSEELVNHVTVITQPLKISAAEDVYTTPQKISLASGEEYTINADYSKKPVAVLLASASIEDAGGVTIEVIAEEYFVWGAVITIKNNDVIAGECNVVINGYPYEVTGEETITAQDDDSILSYGLKKYAYRKNHLVQSPEMAQAIADVLLSSYKTYRKDVTVEWRGDPTLELADIIVVPTFVNAQLGLNVQTYFRVTKNNITYDGTIRETTEGRQI